MNEPDRGVPLDNLLPYELRDVVQHDPIVYAVFLNCALRGTTREEALVECVKHLVKERAEVLDRFRDWAANSPPPVIIVRDRP